MHEDDELLGGTERFSLNNTISCFAEQLGNLLRDLVEVIVI